MHRSADNPFLNLRDAIADRCGWRSLAVSSGELGPHLQEHVGSNHVVCLGMPYIAGSAVDRKQFMVDYGMSMQCYFQQCGE